MHTIQLGQLEILPRGMLQEVQQHAEAVAIGGGYFV